MLVWQNEEQRAYKVFLQQFKKMPLGDSVKQESLPKKLVKKQDEKALQHRVV